MVSSDRSRFRPPFRGMTSNRDRPPSARPQTDTAAAMAEPPSDRTNRNFALVNLPSPPKRASPASVPEEPPPVPKVKVVRMPPAPAPIAATPAGISTKGRGAAGESSQLSSEVRLESIKDLNVQLRLELRLVQAEHEQLLDEERRSQPLEPNTSQHAVLAWSHLLESFSLGWLACRGVASDVCTCCRDIGGRNSSRSSSSNSRQSGMHVAGAHARKPLLDPQGTGRVQVLGEEGVRESHLGRFLKRSNTLKLTEIAEAASPAKPRSRSGSPTRRNGPGSPSRRAGSSLSSEEMGMWYISEDKPEAVAAAGLWCPVHVSKQVWDLSMLSLIVFSCIVIPFRIGMNAPAEGLNAQIDTAITCIFITDLCCNFNTAYLEGNFFVINRRMIAANYLQGWFMIDLASSFPFEACETWVSQILHVSTEGGGEPSHSASFKLLRALRMFRLLRLLRLLKLQQYIDTIEDKLSVNLQVLQIVKMVLGLLYLMHLLGCFWFFVATNSGQETTWLNTYDDGSGVDADVSVQYLYSIYWALMTLTTVGYGDITPANNVERAYALASLLIGALVFGYMLSAIGDLIGSLDKAGGRLQDKLDEVKEFTRWHRMSPELAARVRKYYEFYYSRQSAMDEKGLLNSLAPSLYRDVMMHLLSRTVGTIPLFFVPMLGSQATDPDPPPDVDFQLAVYPLLRPVVRESKEDVVKKGSYSDELFFLHRGSVNAVADWGDCDESGDEQRILYQIVEQGSCISEHVLAEGLADVSYRAIARCEFFCIAKEDLLSLCECFPHARMELANFMHDDLIDHKKMRYWSLRLAARAGARAPKAGVEANEEEREHAQLEWCALRLQVGYLKSRLVKLADKPGHELFPCLFGQPRTRQVDKLRKFASSGRIAVEAFPEAAVAVGVLPFGGALLPKIVSPRAQRAITTGSIGSSASSGSAAARTVEPLTRSGGVPSSDGAEAAGVGAAREGAGALGVDSRMDGLAAGFNEVESRMAANEGQLASIADTLKELLEQRAPARAGES